MPVKDGQPMPMSHVNISTMKPHKSQYRTDFIMAL